MTWPFISYGRLAMISLAYGMGMLLALTRERPRAAMIGARWNAFRPSGRRPDGRFARPACGRRYRRASFSRASARRGTASAGVAVISRPMSARRAMGMIFRRRGTHLIPSARSAGATGFADEERWRAGDRHDQGICAARTHSPVAVVGLGGYPTLPPLFAATLRRIPTSSTTATP